MPIHLYTLRTNQALTPTTQLLTLESQAGQPPLSFRPGQYAGFSFQAQAHFSPVRSFSLVNIPNQNSFLQFAIRIEGAFTQTLATLPLDTPFRVYGPYGSFTPNLEDSRPLILMAGGIGITPFMSIINTATSQLSPRPIFLLYSNRTASDIPFLNQIRQLAQHNPRFHYRIQVTDNQPLPAEPGDLALGRISADIIQSVLSTFSLPPQFFLCGPPSFMQAMSRLLLTLHLPPDAIVSESFGQATPNQTTVSPSTAVYWSSTAGFLVLFLAIFFYELNRLPSVLTVPATTTTTSSTLPTNSTPSPLPSTTSSSPLPQAVSTPLPELTPNTPLPAPLIQPRTAAS